ncbi:hypothetical protein RIF25_00585 [Thermosynechococcaceae cyanobacterium BACA0444]|uniref:Uncharacterized protein n=1 Tax=Pseudocalidococcus azoricus BACA0444 TaxID=2918990 RepID=A0AAE4FQ68_9CYAN|nr:hypothetical protein [Pseudocalidococcus azoricus]MDS3859292.1 hypothetical protein [Pseudocalidococcus azoricus BACA0444]
MSFRLEFTLLAVSTLNDLEKTNPQKHRKVLKTLGLLSKNPRHPGLKTHKYQTLTGPNGEEVFEAYVENKTPGAFRVFWFYGPVRNTITVVAITPHP